MLKIRVSNRINSSDSHRAILGNLEQWTKALYKFCKVEETYLATTMEQWLEIPRGQQRGILDNGQKLDLALPRE